MTYSQGNNSVVLSMVSPLGLWGGMPQGLTTAATSNSYEAANLAVYFPILVPTVCVAKRMWWTNGSTVSATYNVDAGIYLDAGYKPGAKLISTGSTAQGTASQVQFVDITDTTLTPGLYWLALACSSGSATFFAVTSGVAYDALFRYTQSDAFPLPATATPVESGNYYFYVFGFATTASP